MQWILTVVIAVVVAVIGFVAGITYRKKVAEREITSAEEEARRIVNEAIKSAESKKREALVEAKEEIHRNRSEYEREVKERRAEITKQERRLQQKEENLDKKLDAADKKNEVLAAKIADAEAQQQEIGMVEKSQLEMLEKISGFTVEEAKAYLIANIRDELEQLNEQAHRPYTLKFGIAVGEYHPGMNANDLIEAADHALYEIKRARPPRPH